MCNTQSSGVNLCKLEETFLSILGSSATKTRLQFIILVHSKIINLKVNTQLSNAMKKIFYITNTNNDHMTKDDLCLQKHSLQSLQSFQNI